MSSEITLAKGLVAACDFINTIASFSKLRQPDRPAARTPLELASLVNRLISCGFTFLEVGAVIQGVGNKTLANLKKLELAPRFIEVPIKAHMEAHSLDGSLEGCLRFAEKGVLAPVADLIRVGAEKECYYEKSLLEMPSQEREKVRCPVYKYDHVHGEYVLAGYKPFNIEESRLRLELSQSSARMAGLFRVGAEVGLMSSAAAAGKSIYERLIHLLHRNCSEEARDQRDLSLISLAYIPSPLHEDVVFKEHICPITQEPIRHPVGDPNGVTIYEKGAILNWLRVRPVSPMTRNPLTPDQLISKPGLQALIDHRLRFHERKLWSYIESSPAFQENLLSPAAEERTD